MLWLKSRSSEVWLERRTHYTRSCAVMSMVRPLASTFTILTSLGQAEVMHIALQSYSR